jgi:hypothetical protein
MEKKEDVQVLVGAGMDASGVERELAAKMVWRQEGVSSSPLVDLVQLVALLG